MISDAEILPQWFPEGWLLVLNDLMEEGENDKQVGWIYSPNIRVIKIAPWCIWVKICFNPANTLEMYMYVAFKNPRDQLGMRNLLLQAFPTQRQDVQNTFRRVTEQPSGYLLWDLHQKSSDDRRILSH